MNLIEKVTALFREVFDDKELIITKETNATHVESWDSFMQINLVVAFEEQFDVQFTTEEIGRLTCVGDMLELLRNKGVE